MVVTLFLHIKLPLKCSSLLAVLLPLCLQRKCPKSPSLWSQNQLTHMGFDSLALHMDIFYK